MGMRVTARRVGILGRIITIPWSCSRGRIRVSVMGEAGRLLCTFVRGLISLVSSVDSVGHYLFFVWSLLEALYTTVVYLLLCSSYIKI